jgi:hypothetical protein
MEGDCDNHTGQKIAFNVIYRKLNRAGYCFGITINLTLKGAIDCWIRIELSGMRKIPHAPGVIMNFTPGDLPPSMQSCKKTSGAQGAGRTLRVLLVHTAWIGAESPVFCVFADRAERAI